MMPTISPALDAEREVVQNGRACRIGEINTFRGHCTQPLESDVAVGAGSAR